MVALQQRNQDAIDSLLELPDIDLTRRTRLGEVALHVAARACTPKEISGLLAMNPTPLNVMDRRERTLFLGAFCARGLENCEQLLKAEADACIGYQRD